MNDRLRLFEQITDCTRCELYKGVDSPLPMKGEKLPCRLLVVGDAPSMADHEAGESFSGAMGDTLESLMAEAGIDTDDCAYINTVQCCPGKSLADRHIDTCATNVHSVMKYAQPEFVLLLGAGALYSVCESITYKEMRGRPLRRGERLHFCTYHPREATKSRLFAKSMQEDLAKLAQVMDGKAKWTDFISDHCSVCGEWAEWWAEDGLPSCAEHAPRAYKVWMGLAPLHEPKAAPPPIPTPEPTQLTIA